MDKHRVMSRTDGFRIFVSTKQFDGAREKKSVQSFLEDSCIVGILDLPDEGIAV
jgi:hypothetical protein